MCTAAYSSPRASARCSCSAPAPSLQPPAPDDCNSDQQGCRLTAGRPFAICSILPCMTTSVFNRQSLLPSLCFQVSSSWLLQAVGWTTGFGRSSGWSSYRGSSRVVKLGSCCSVCVFAAKCSERACDASAAMADLEWCRVSSCDVKA